MTRTPGLKPTFNLGCILLIPAIYDDLQSNLQALEMEVQPPHMTFRPHHIDFS